MSTFIIHLLIPVLIVLALGLFRTRDVWAWCWPAWAGDTDYLGWVAHVKWGIPNTHRALFHNVLLLYLLLVLSANAFERWRRVHGGLFRDFLDAKPAWILVPYFYASHLVFDLFAGGIAPFWPLSDRTVFWDFEITVDTTKPIPTPEIQSEPGTSPGVVPVSEAYQWMTGEQFAFFLLYALVMSLWLLQAWTTRRATARRSRAAAA